MQKVITSIVDFFRIFLLLPKYAPLHETIHYLDTPIHYRKSLVDVILKESYSQISMDKFISGEAKLIVGYYGFVGVTMNNEIVKKEK